MNRAKSSDSQLLGFGVVLEPHQVNDFTECCAFVDMDPEEFTLLTMQGIYQVECFHLFIKTLLGFAVIEISNPLEHGFILNVCEFTSPEVRLNGCCLLTPFCRESWRACEFVTYERVGIEASSMVFSKICITAGDLDILLGLSTAPVLAVTSVGVNAGCSVWLMTGVYLVTAQVVVPAALK